MNMLEEQFEKIIKAQEQRVVDLTNEMIELIQDFSSKIKFAQETAHDSRITFELWKIRNKD